MRGMTDSKENIVRLMAAKVLGQALTGDEERALAAWLDASPDNRMLFERVASARDARSIVELEREDYGKKMAARVLEKVGEGSGRSMKRLVYAWAGCAAAVIVACVVVFYGKYP